MEVAVNNPEAIVFDEIKESYHFFVLLGDKGHRVAIAFDAIPDKTPIARADILTTVFIESRFRGNLEKIKKGDKPSLSLIYEANERLTGLVTHSKTGFKLTVPQSPENKNSSSFNFNIQNCPENVNLTSNNLDNRYLKI